MKRVSAVCPTMSSLIPLCASPSSVLARANEGSITERREHRTVKVWRLDMQGDAPWKWPIAASQPFPYLRHLVDQVNIGCHGFEL